MNDQSPSISVEVSDFRRSLEFLIKVGARGGPAGSSSERAVRSLLSAMTNDLRINAVNRWLDLEGEAANAAACVLSMWLRVPACRHFICDEIHRGIAGT